MAYEWPVKQFTAPRLQPKDGGKPLWGIRRDGGWMTLPAALQQGHEQVTTWARAAAVCSAIKLDPAIYVIRWFKDEK